MQGLINKILNYSAVDGAGNRLVIFFQGCNFDCKYCHNPETINVCNDCGICVKKCKSNALSIKETKVIWNSEKCVNCDNCIKVCPNFSSPKVLKMTVSEIMLRIEKVRPFISGITISGGECTTQYEFLLDLLVECQMKNISVYIDTNANLEHSKMQTLSKYFDKVMPDVKVFDNVQHIELTGKSNELVLQNVEYLLQKNKIHEIRTVIYPNLKNEETVEQVSKLISKYDKNVIYKLIKFRPNGVRSNLNKNLKEITDEKMIFLKNIAEENGCFSVVIV
jgi:YjjW family glycine radical enzyme activase